MKNKRKKSGFTIVELLTVMAIIAILMGLLVPAMNQVRKLAKDTSQRAQFRTIDTALEQYHGDNAMYPESSVSPLSIQLAAVGSHKFTEALVGRDLLGFDPKSSWEPEIDESNKDIYATQQISGTNQSQVDDSLKRRQSPYLDVQKVEAFQLAQLFNTSLLTNIYPGNLDNTGKWISGHVSAPVLTDVYRAKKVTLVNGTTVTAGTPILYYKANTSSKRYPDTMKTTSDNTDDIDNTATVADANQAGYIYNIMDNDELVKLGLMMKPASLHHFDKNYTEDVDGENRNGVWIFYNTITNPKMTTPRPYNPDTYILISAGGDGIYGTKDDIYNFQP